MKKIVLIIAAMLTTVAASAMNLREAFNALSHLPNVSVTSPDYNLNVSADDMTLDKLAAGYNLDRKQIRETGNAAYVILNQVPMSYMINGANNGEVAAFVYATPNREGTNDILIVAMSGYRGSAVFMYGTAHNAFVEAVKNAPLTMQGDYLSLHVDEDKVIGRSEFNIILNKAR